MSENLCIAGFALPRSGLACETCGAKSDEACRQYPRQLERKLAAAEFAISDLRAELAKAERERDEAREALAQAREAALEQAARACETLTGSDATPTLRPGARMCLHRIRALKSTPTQESETP